MEGLGMLKAGLKKGVKSSMAAQRRCVSACFSGDTASEVVVGLLVQLDMHSP